VSRAITLVLLVACAACGATPRPASTSPPLRPFYVSATAPPCVEDESELGASIAALRWDDGETAEVLTPAQSVLVRAAHDCSVATRVRQYRLSTSEALAEGCAPSGPEELCHFVRSCWARGGTPERTCSESDLARVTWLFGMFEQAGASLPGLFEHDPAGRPDAPTVYVETGTFFVGQGHLVQRVDGVWRVVASAVVWQA
jgi:hypothetical protein